MRKFQHAAARRRLGIFLLSRKRDPCFNTQPPEGGWGLVCTSADLYIPFQHAAARRRLESTGTGTASPVVVSTRSRPKAAGLASVARAAPIRVSTRSRPKAAGADGCCFAFHIKFQHAAARRRLDPIIKKEVNTNGFNTQPPEGGWIGHQNQCCRLPVSTRSRPKAAGQETTNEIIRLIVSTRSRPKAAGCIMRQMQHFIGVSTRSRPKAAGVGIVSFETILKRFQHAAARRRLAGTTVQAGGHYGFQHAAARRRLEGFPHGIAQDVFVSTRSRPKAAGAM